MTLPPLEPKDYITLLVIGGQALWNMWLLLENRKKERENQRLKRIDVEHELRVNELEKKQIETAIINNRIFDREGHSLLPEMENRLEEIRVNRERLQKILGANP